MAEMVEYEWTLHPWDWQTVAVFLLCEPMEDVWHQVQVEMVEYEWTLYPWDWRTVVVFLLCELMEAVWYQVQVLL